MEELLEVILDDVLVLLESWRMDSVSAESRHVVGEQSFPHSLSSPRVASLKPLQCYLSLTGSEFLSGSRRLAWWFRV